MTPAEHAMAFRENFGLTENQVVPDLVKLLTDEGYHYCEDDYGDDFDAFTERISGFKFLIGFNSRNNYGDAFKRFSIAHELGHIAMHSGQLQQGIRHESRSIRDPKKGIEREANEFAAFFLMPSQPFRLMCEHMDFSPKSLRQLATHFKVSDLAAAIHFIDHTSLHCSLVVSSNSGLAKWEKRSKSMQTLVHPARFIVKVKPPECSLTAGWTPGSLVDAKATGSLKKWLPGLHTDHDCEERVIKTADGLFLTLLTALPSLSIGGDRSDFVRSHH
jgi:Zn-dependent peptidase ImmA (M78 family)